MSTAPAAKLTAPRLEISPTGWKVAFALLCIAFAGAYTYRLNPSTPAVISVPVDQIPNVMGEWTGKEESTIESRSRELLQLDRYVRRMYHAGTDRSVFLYVGYWNHQTGDAQAAKHTPALCLPSNGWHIERLGKSTVEVPFGDGKTRTLPINRIAGEIERKRYLIYYFFTNGTEYYPEEWQSLARISWNSLLRRRTDGGIIEISTDLGPGPDGMKKAEETLLDFLGEFQPRLDGIITGAR